MILVFVIALWCFLEVALKDVIKYSHVTRCFSPTSRDVFQTSSWESYSTRSILQSVCHIKINIKYIGNLWVVNSLFQIYKPYWSLAPGQFLCKIIEVNGIVNKQINRYKPYPICDRFNIIRQIWNCSPLAKWTILTIKYYL
jgi:hypothetical protein